MGGKFGPHVLSVSEDSLRLAFIGPSEYTVTVANARSLDEVSFKWGYLFFLWFVANSNKNQLSHSYMYHRVNSLNRHLPQIGTSRARLCLSFCLTIRLISLWWTLFQRVNYTDSDVSKILGLQVHVISSQGIKQLGCSLGYIFLFLPIKVARGQAHSSQVKSLAHGPQWQIWFTCKWLSSLIFKQSGKSVVILPRSCSKKHQTVWD